MPAIEVISVRDNTGDSGTETTWTGTLTDSSALTNGDDFLVFGLVNSTNDGANEDPHAELEFRFGTTRIAYNTISNEFGLFNAGDSAKGHVGRCFAVVSGDGSSTINLRRQGPGAFAGAEHLVDGYEMVAINLGDIGTEGTDYHWSESTNNDAASTTTSGTTWLRAGNTATSTTAAQSGEVQFTPGITENYLIGAYVEGWFDSSAATADQLNARLRLVEDPAGTPSTTTIGHEEPCGIDADATNPDEVRKSFMMWDVRELTASTTYRIQWEVQGSGSHTNGEAGRFRTFAVPLSAFEDSAFITNGGDAVSTGSEVGGANDLSFNFDTTSHNVVVLASGPTTNAGTWAHSILRQDPDGTSTDYPSPTNGDGRFEGGATAAGAACCTHLAYLTGVTGAEDFRLIADSDTGTEHRVGRNLADNAAARTVLVALRMDTPDSGSSASTDATLSSLSLSADAEVDVDVSTSETLSSLQLSATADVDVSASASTTLSSVGLVSTGDVLVSGATATTLNDLSITATAAVDAGVTASTNATLSSVSLSATADVDVDATAGVTLSNVGLAATADVDIGAETSQTLSGLALAATASVGTPGLSASVSATLAPVGVSASATVDVEGTANTTLGNLTLAAEGDVTVTASVTVTLSNITTGSGFALARVTSYEITDNNTTWALTDANTSWTVADDNSSWTIVG